MNSLFRTVLVPVDFTMNTKVAIERALELSTDPAAAIHLLHVFNKDPKAGSPGFLRKWLTGERKSEELDVKNKLIALSDFIRARNRNVMALAWTAYGAVEGTIAEKAKQISADVIVVGKKSVHSWLPVLNTVVPTRLAMSSGVAVLTVKPGSLNNPIKTVVIPMDDAFPERKIAMVYAVRRKSWIRIRLITFSGSGNITSVLPASLLNTYRLLKSDMGNDVSCNVLRGSNRARALLEYCKKVDADLLIVNPETETKMGWMNTHIADVLPAESKTQILAIGQT